MLLFHFAFDLLWRSRGFSVNSAAFLGFRELKGIEMHGTSLSRSVSEKTYPKNAEVNRFRLILGTFMTSCWTD
jgi:hypothetical protein